MEELVGQCATAIVPDSYMALFNGELAENKCERLGATLSRRGCHRVAPIGWLGCGMG
jgi:hypothetical protein